MFCFEVVYAVSVCDWVCGVDKPKNAGGDIPPSANSYDEVWLKYVEQLRGSLLAELVYLCSRR